MFKAHCVPSAAVVILSKVYEYGMPIASRGGGAKMIPRRKTIIKRRLKYLN